MSNENACDMNNDMLFFCSRLGYDYRHLMDEKRRIGYTGPGLSKFDQYLKLFIAFSCLVVPKRTEVDEVLLKNIDVPFGIWLYKYVRLYVRSNMSFDDGNKSML
jgi:hypothetical protein